MHRPRTSRLGALALVIVLGPAVLVACSDSDSGSTPDSGSPKSVDVVRVYTEHSSDITVTNGHTFAVALPVTSGTGYAWTAESNPKLQQMTSEQVSAPSKPGGQATQRITFRAQGTGSTTLVLNYARSFEPDEPPAETASFAVTIVG
jgi:predicted secreted protein